MSTHRTLVPLRRVLLSLCTRCALYIRHDTVIAVNHSSDNNKDDTSLHSLQKTYDTCGCTHWIAPRLSPMRRNSSYQERYPVCVRDSSGRAAENVRTVRVIHRLYAERQQITLHEAERDASSVQSLPLVIHHCSCINSEPFRLALQLLRHGPARHNLN
jgi:hypothetical protein